MLKFFDALIHYKVSCPFQLMHLQLVSKSTIFVTINVIAEDPLQHLVKMIYGCINEYKVICSCTCDLDLWSMSIWIKIKMKNTFISYIFNGIPK
jgi:hypothetical protein